MGPQDGGKGPQDASMFCTVPYTPHFASGCISHLGSAGEERLAQGFVPLREFQTTFCSPA